MNKLLTYLQALLSRFVGKNSTDTQFVGDLDWSRAVTVQSSFVKGSLDWTFTYIPAESGVCFFSVTDIVQGLYISKSNNGLIFSCLNTTIIWPTVTSVVAKATAINFGIRADTLPTHTITFVPFMRAS